jgi:hypothetical protein
MLGVHAIWGGATAPTTAGDRAGKQNWVNG